MNIFSTNTSQHSSPYEIFNGEQTPHQEVPARAETIYKALHGANFQITKVNHLGGELVGVLQSIHTPRYLSFLDDTHSLDESYHYPSVFSYRPDHSEPTNPNARRGFFSFDLYTPLNNYVYQAALQSANIAKLAAETTLQTGEVTYALCRPPGHHAEREKMGGYCYINNAAVAATVLLQQGKVAILDVDFHHGNGTENIFADSDEVLTVSIHADPEFMFPFFSGSKATGYMSNLNYPLQLGTTDRMYQRVLEEALAEISAFRPESLVVAFGADTHELDPIGGFALTTSYYSTMANSIRQLHLPTTIVQEGGYNTELLGTNVVGVLQGFEFE